jgi:hypothetical protein
MMKWVELQLSDGTFEERPFLKKETLQGMHTLQVSFRKFPEEASNYFGYGLGWMVGMHKGRYIVSHGGGIDGFISSVGFLPKEKIGVVVLTNSDSSMMFPNSLAEAILDQMLGIAEDDWISKVKEKDEKMKSAFQGDSGKIDPGSSVNAGIARPHSDYIGEFEHPAYGTIRVHEEGDELMLSYHTLSMPLSHRCYDHFTGKWQHFLEVTYNCSFVRDHFGDISELNMPLESTVGPISFKRKAGSELLAVDYLKQFEGEFESDLYPVHIALKGNQLKVTVPGAPEEFALIPEKSLQFSIKELPGFTTRFTSASDGKITEMLFITPNGTFSFKAK